MADIHPYPIHNFLMEAHNIAIEAQFIVDSLPNADLAAVERITHQLDAVREIVNSINDPSLPVPTIQGLLELVDGLLSSLEQFINHPPPPANAHVPRESTGLPGRPRLTLDMERALLLHDLGNSWDSIAKAMGTVRSTLYLHLD